MGSKPTWVKTTQCHCVFARELLTWSTTMLESHFEAESHRSLGKHSEAATVGPLFSKQTFWRKKLQVQTPDLCKLLSKAC